MGVVINGPALEDALTALELPTTTQGSQERQGKNPSSEPLLKITALLPIAKSVLGENRRCGETKHLPGQVDSLSGRKFTQQKLNGKGNCQKW